MKKKSVDTQEKTRRAYRDYTEKRIVFCVCEILFRFNPYIPLLHFLLLRNGIYDSIKKKLFNSYRRFNFN